MKTDSSSFSCEQSLVSRELTIGLQESRDRLPVVNDSSSESSSALSFMMSEAKEEEEKKQV